MKSFQISHKKRFLKISKCNNLSSKQWDLRNIESFEKPQNSKLSKKDFDEISFGNRGYSKSSINNKIKESIKNV